MKSVLLLLLATFCMAVGSLRAEKPFEGDSLGSLELGQSAEAVTKALGKPASKGKDVEWEAIGEWVQEWHFPKQGLTLAMNSEKKGGAKTILSITAEARAGWSHRVESRSGAPRRRSRRPTATCRTRKKASRETQLWPAPSMAARCST